MPLTKRKPKGSALRKGDKVVAAIALPGVAEGTSGKVKLVNGLVAGKSWARCWVFFDNGVDRGSIDSKHLVRASEWAEYQVKRAEDAERGTANVSAASDGGSAGTQASAPAADQASSKVPEHLLERTRNRRKALGL